MKLQEKEISAYEAEHQNSAEQLMREMPPFKEAERFLELVQAHDEIRRFLLLTEERPTLLSAPWRMLTCFSYYCADDLLRKR